MASAKKNPNKQMVKPMPVGKPKPMGKPTPRPVGMTKPSTIPGVIAPIPIGGGRPKVSKKQARKYSNRAY